MKQMLLTAFLGFMIGVAATLAYVANSVALLQDENQAQARQLDKYERTVDGLYSIGFTPARVNEYIEKGCVPYVEWVK